jgi:hypothetical protein
MTPLRYREVSLDSDPLAEVDQNDRELDRLMREQPTPMSERITITTRNGNAIRPQAR